MEASVLIGSGVVPGAEDGLEAGEDFFPAGDVEDGVHHAGHGDGRGGAYGDRETVVEGAAQLIGEPGKGFVDFVERKSVAGPVLLESVNRYDESGWHAEAKPGHGDQVGALVAEKGLVFAVVGETIDVGHGKYLTRSCRPA